MSPKFAFFALWGLIIFFLFVGCTAHVISILEGTSK